MLTLLLLACSGPTETSTFTEVQTEVFNNSCAFSTCHGDGGGAQGLSLADGSAYDAIVGVPATLAPEFNLVEPGDHEASYIWQKCANFEGIIGEAMPSVDGLGAEQLAILESWIDGGALDD